MRPTATVVAGGLLLIALLFPIYSMLAASVTTEPSLFAAPPLVPVAFSFEHYRALFDERDFLIPIRNSIVVAAVTTALALRRVPMHSRGCEFVATG
jgi:multiple sugar transport system permease protein